MLACECETGGVWSGGGPVWLKTASVEMASSPAELFRRASSKLVLTGEKVRAPVTTVKPTLASGESDFG